jgi:O-acetylserine/cysteine efflux transporter
MPIGHVLLGVLIALIWAANFIAVRLGLDAGMPPVLLTGLRFLAVAMLLPLVRRPLGWPSMLGLTLALGLGQYGLSTLSVAAGLSPGIAPLAMQTQVFFTMGLGAFLLGERPNRRSVFGASVAGFGIALLAVNRGAGAGAPPLLGLALALAAALSWAFGNLVLRRIGKGVSALAVAIWIAAIAALPLLALSWVLEGSPVTALRGLRAPAMAAGVVLYTAVGSTVTATAVWTWLLSRHPAGRVAPLSLLVPVFAMSLAALLLGEHFAMSELLAAGIVLAGLVISLLPYPRRPRLLQTESGCHETPEATPRCLAAPDPRPPAGIRFRL